MKYSRTDLSKAVISPTFKSTNDKVSAFEFKRQNAKILRAGKKKKKGQRRRNRIPLQYKVYIKSRHWAQRKNRYYQMHGRRCAVCKTLNFVDLHHKKYGNYGWERDEDLVPLCKAHHEAFHTQHGVSRDMRDNTEVYVHTALFDEEADRAMRAIR